MVAQRNNRKIALLSIQPRFVDLIIQGRKQVEFRRVKFKHDVSHVVVYATKPIQKIICYFEVLKIDEGNPEKLWVKYRKFSGIGKDEYQMYYKSCDIGVAIKIGEVKKLKKPIQLSKIATNLVPPQSFLYLSHADFQKITNYYKSA